MSDPLIEVEAAIEEVTKARQLVMQRKTKQVSATNEIDQLKSVAFAWFRSHRPQIANLPSCNDLAGVDDSLRAVIDATGRHSARTTYAVALRQAKVALVAVRTLVASLPNPTQQLTTSSATTDSPPNFAPLAADPQMQAILNRRWDEVQHCIGADAYLAATVMMGGLLESLLLARINGSVNPGAVFTAKGAPRDKAGKTLPLGEWKLVKMVEVAHELAWITKSAKDVGNVLRDFRNYIHPHKEHADSVTILEDDALMFWEVTKAITRQVLNSVAKTP